MVIWFSHAGTLIRAAPEHLRAATPLETQSYDVAADVGIINYDST